MGHLLEWLYPARCPVCDDVVVPRGRDICEKCQDAYDPIGDVCCVKCGKRLDDEGAMYCSGCLGKNHYFDECRSAFMYDDTMRISMYRFKYHGRREYASYFAREIVRILGPKITEYNPQVLIPVPMYYKKERQRGYNQAYLLAREISNLINIPVLNNYIVRNKSTKTMRSLGARERENNLKKAFKINGDVVKLTNAIVIDDIFTTGATMDGVSGCLKDSGVKNVYGICLSSGKSRE